MGGLGEGWGRGGRGGGAGVEALGGVLMTMGCDIDSEGYQTRCG
jgi:hypothetical protein